MHKKRDLSTPLQANEIAEVYSCTDCGGIFIPGNANHDNLFEKDNGGTERRGECPSCGSENPDMNYLGSLFEDK